MKVEVLADSQLLHVRFEAADESVTSEVGAMVTMSPGTRMTIRSTGGLIAAARRKESFVQNVFTASAAGDSVILAPAVEGVVECIELEAEETIFLNSANYLAHTGASELGARRGEARDFFDGGSLLLHLDGPCQLYINGCGALDAHELTEIPRIAEPARVAAFSGTANHMHRPFSGYRGVQFPLRTRLVQFTGTGRLWLQTRDPSVLAAFVRPFAREHHLED